MRCRGARPSDTCRRVRLSVTQQSDVSALPANEGEVGKSASKARWYSGSKSRFPESHSQIIFPEITQSTRNYGYYFNIETVDHFELSLCLLTHHQYASWLPIPAAPGRKQTGSYGIIWSEKRTFAAAHLTAASDHISVICGRPVGTRKRSQRGRTLQQHCAYGRRLRSSTHKPCAGICSCMREDRGHQERYLSGRNRIVSMKAIRADDAWRCLG